MTNDPTKAAEDFLRDLYECDGPECCPDMAEAYPDSLPLAVAFAKAQRRQGAVDALRAAADSLELAWATSPNSSKYPGPLNEWLRAEADRIEAGEDGE